jgi:hypothetical protein
MNIAKISTDFVENIICWTEIGIAFWKTIFGDVLLGQFTQSPVDQGKFLALILTRNFDEKG